MPLRVGRQLDRRRIQHLVVVHGHLESVRIHQAPRVLAVFEHQLVLRVNRLCARQQLRCLVRMTQHARLGRPLHQVAHPLRPHHRER